MIALPEIGVILASALVTGLAALAWVLRKPPTEAPAPVAEEPLELLFDEGVLHHATRRAMAELTLEPGLHGWDELRNELLPYFPDFPTDPGTGPEGRISLRADEGAGLQEALIRWRGPLCWVSLIGGDDAEPVVPSLADKAELDALRLMSGTTPSPVWQENESGQVIWFNDAYETLFRMVHGAPVTPQTRLFSECAPDTPNRVALRTEGNEQPDWYDVTSVHVEGVTAHHAICINAVVAAEEAQRNFVQTLAKTFAQLPIGLAIFDRNGQLTLFNPALVELTGLPAHFLSARPTMLSFFDQLRENRRMPEPKNYRSWRVEIADVIAAATDGRYKETWTLETGQTYNVCGRRHPDGATAFLIEDISAEMTLTRNFRAELEQAQLMMDVVDDAMVVFSPSGHLTFCNAAYRALWQTDPDKAFANVTVYDCIKAWQERCSTDAGWAAVEDFVNGRRNQSPWQMTLTLADGLEVICHVNPIPSGATLIRFRDKLPAKAVPTEKRPVARVG